jgi:DNA-binding ferritin-like protein
MLEQLISRTFAMRNAAHLAHWRARGPGSYAKHSALGDFYDDLIDKLDTIVEAYQAMTGELIGVVKLDAQDTKRDILSTIKDECDWLQENREEIADNNAAIENMIDELTATYMAVIYKLTFLA